MRRIALQSTVFIFDLSFVWFEETHTETNNNCSLSYYSALSTRSSEMSRGRGRGQRSDERGGWRGGRWRGSGRGYGHGRGGELNQTRNGGGETNSEIGDGDSFHRPWNHRRGGRSRGRHRRPRFNPGNGIFQPTIIDVEALREARKCCECDKEDAQYRCPSCLKKYCSLPCYKEHKGSPKCEPISKTDSAKTDQMDTDINGNPSTSAGSSRRKATEPRKYIMFPTKDTVRPEGLAKLTQEPLRSQLTEMFKSDTLREQIKTLEESMNPRAIFRPYLQNPEFSNFNNTIVDALSDELYNMAVQSRRF